MFRPLISNERSGGRACIRNASVVPAAAPEGAFDTRLCAFVIPSFFDGREYDRERWPTIRYRRIRRVSIDVDPDRMGGRGREGVEEPDVVAIERS